MTTLASLRPPRRDVVIALAFVAWTTAEVVFGGVSGAAAPNLVAASVATVPLAWRRVVPEAAALGCASGVVLKTAFGLDMDGLAMLSAILFASYTVGRHVPARRSLPVIGVMIGAVWVALTLWVHHKSINDYLFGLLWVGGPGVAGAVLREQVRRVSANAGRAARAEMEREAHARDAVREERLRIAREMHDTVAHAVSVIVLHAGAVRSRLPDELSSERAALADTEEAGRQAIAELRRLLGLLRSPDHPTGTDPQPTLGGLQSLMEETRCHGLEVALQIDGRTRPLDPAIEVSAYRILQEALTNVRKHAQARTVSVLVAYGDDTLRMRVEDDGVGRRAGTGGGFGLRGIRERVDVYGGELAAGPAAAGGFAVEVSLPVRQA